MVLESRTQKGRRGECLASDRLMNHGHRILERNWRWGKFEVDLISRADSTIIFHEIKLRSGCDALPEPSMWAPRSGQRSRIARAAHQYMRLRGWGDLSWRFDVWLVCLDSSKPLSEPQIRWFQDAFMPEPIA